MQKGVYYFFMLIAIFGGMELFTMWREANGNSLLTSAAVKPDLLLDNTKYYLKEHAYERSMSQLDDAIKAIRNIEADLDAESRVIIESSVADLERVREEMEMDSLVTEDLNRAFSNALSALTLAELKVSEILIKQDHPMDAIVAMKYGMLHIKNALKYAQGKKKEYELHIYEELDSLLDSRHVGEDQVIAKLEEMIKELDMLVAQDHITEEQASSSAH